MKVIVVALDGTPLTINYTDTNEIVGYGDYSFNLTNVYPNPFNPVTQIQYALPEDIHVELIIYDILGRQVTELINTDQQAGYYQATWNGDQNSSGLYFVKMVAGDYISTQKLMLVK